MTFGFQIVTRPGEIPPPLDAINLFYPAQLGIATSGLGLNSCAVQTLQAEGPEGCPTDSLSGNGNAIVEIPVGPEIVKETARITFIAGPLQDGHLTFLIYASGATPINAQIILPTLLLPATAPFGGRLHLNVPLVPSLPEGPDAAVVSLQSTLGPLGLTYYEHAHGKTIAYHPKGILLPNTCPHGGFPLAATFTFFSGTHAHTNATVPCPRNQDAHYHQPQDYTRTIESAPTIPNVMRRPARAAAHRVSMPW